MQMLPSKIALIRWSIVYKLDIRLFTTRRSQLNNRFSLLENISQYIKLILTAGKCVYRYIQYLQTLKGENRSWCIWYIVKISCLLASDDEEVLEQRSDPGNILTHSALYRIYTRIMVLGPPTIAVLTLFVYCQSIFGLP